MNDHTSWTEINDNYLAATTAWILLRLEQLSETAKDKNKPVAIDRKIHQARRAMSHLENYDPPPALVLLGNALGLSNFERQVIALCAAMELDARTAGLCARAQHDASKTYPTFSLALELFDASQWNALSPYAPLRHLRLLEINQPGAQPLTGAALSADERIVNYLKGLNYLDDRITPLLDPTGAQPSGQTLPASQQRIVDAIVEQLQHPEDGQKPPVIGLSGRACSSKYLIARCVALLSDLNLHTMSIKNLPGHSGEFESFIRLWQRESRLLPLALYIDTDAGTDTEKIRLKRFLERSSGVIFVELDNDAIDINRELFPVEVSKPTPEEQDHLWKAVLQNQANVNSQRLAEQFSFSQDEIVHLAKATLAGSSRNKTDLKHDLWQACRIKARTGMEQLASRVNAKATWEQLVLPPEQTSLLAQITDQVAQRNRVYELWGFRNQMNRGLGISALFTGETGTGKTMAAEVIANTLELDLYRIDLSSVVSKYIGETEKNLRKLFDAAEDSGAILFFDEADALFGKRSEVKDSHDRYANIEINYLLQRMESYKGLAILASNMKSALDKAFVRRLRFIVDFPFPGIEERVKIWQKIFPPETPVENNLDFERLARLNLTGGNIHSVALNAAFLAARQGIPVSMPLIMDAARTEFRKLERPAKESDFSWHEDIEAAI